ncbi:MAG: hypothetical protein PVJ57_09005 [Phycisphaerae bacterium]|jgi:hypothetical protein
MKRRLTLLPVVAAALSIAGLLVVAGGCHSGGRAERPPARRAPARPHGHAESLAGRDADRARADLDRQERDSRTRPPAAPPAHSGSRAVDQPRH